MMLYVLIVLQSKSKKIEIMKYEKIANGVAIQAQFLQKCTIKLD